MIKTHLLKDQIEYVLNGFFLESMKFKFSFFITFCQGDLNAGSHLFYIFGEN